MILIDLNNSRTELNGTKSQLVTEYIVLAHTFIEAIVKKLPKKDREALEHVIALAFMNEMGLDVLEDSGLVQGHTMVDVSQLSHLMKEDGGHETD
jgi:hypothetical protein